MKMVVGGTLSVVGVGIVKVFKVTVSGGVFGGSTSSSRGLQVATTSDGSR